MNKEVRIMDWSDYSFSSQDTVTHCYPTIKEGSVPGNRVNVVVIEEGLNIKMQKCGYFGILDVKILSLKTGETYYTKSNFLRPHVFKSEEEFNKIKIHNKSRAIINVMDLNLISGIEKFIIIKFLKNRKDSSMNGKEIKVNIKDFTSVPFSPFQFESKIENSYEKYMHSINKILFSVLIDPNYRPMVASQMTKETTNEDTNPEFKLQAYILGGSVSKYKEAISVTRNSNSMFISTWLSDDTPKYYSTCKSLFVKKDFCNMKKFYRTLALLNDNYEYFSTLENENEKLATEVILRMSKINFVIDDYDNVFFKNIKKEVVKELLLGVETMTMWNLW